jgi:hypothetical protein
LCRKTTSFQNFLDLSTRYICRYVFILEVLDFLYGNLTNSLNFAIFIDVDSCTGLEEQVKTDIRIWKFVIISRFCTQKQNELWQVATVTVVSELSIDECYYRRKQNFILFYLKIILFYYLCWIALLVLKCSSYTNPVFVQCYRERKVYFFYLCFRVNCGN